MLRAVVIFLTAVLVSWVAALFFAPVDSFQGDVYRIIYLHVPAAFSAFFFGFVLLYHSIAQLTNKSDNHDLFALSAAELGGIFTALTLFTGMIWGKPTWGVYWTWDPRLTTTFLLGLLFAAYVLLFHSITDPNIRRKSCAILGIFIFIDIPIIYQSVKWWRTLHQPQSILRMNGPSTIDPEMKFILIFSIISLIGLAFCLYRMKAQIKINRNIWEEKQLSS